jgi:transposase
MCSNVEVKLLYLSPYLLDLNPIEEFFAELKAFIRKQRHEYEDNPNQDFAMFLEWYISIVGGRDRSAEGHFMHVGILVEAF